MGEFSPERETSDMKAVSTRVPGHADTGQWTTFSAGPAPPVSHIDHRSDEGSGPA